MTPSEAARERLEARARELRYLGTHFEMSGVSMPSELAAEYERVRAELDALSPEEPPPTADDPRSER